ncbi:MAG TPA: hypothetical protein ENI53_01275 [Thermoplasmatales archaeon]|nr:hypothetical protein [Thermoplasmatales archaeon]
MRKLATFLCLSLILFGTIEAVNAATSGGSGLNRWVLLQDTTGTNYTVKANVTVTETVYDDTPTSFKIVYTINNTGNTTSNTASYTVSITIGDQSASNTSSLNITYNHTQVAYVEFKAMQLLNGTNSEGNNTITIVLKAGSVQKDSWSGYIEVIKYGFGMNIWLSLIPAIVSIVVVVKVVEMMKKKFKF